MQLWTINCIWLRRQSFLWLIVRLYSTFSGYETTAHHTTQCSCCTLRTPLSGLLYNQQAYWTTLNCEYWCATTLIWKTPGVEGRTNKARFQDNFQQVKNCKERTYSISVISISLFPNDVGSFFLSIKIRFEIILYRIVNPTELIKLIVQGTANTHQCRGRHKYIWKHELHSQQKTLKLKSENVQTLTNKTSGEITRKQAHKTVITTERHQITKRHQPNYQNTFKITQNIKYKNPTTATNYIFKKYSVATKIIKNNGSIFTASSFFIRYIYKTFSLGLGFIRNKSSQRNWSERHGLKSSVVDVLPPPTSQLY